MAVTATNNLSSLRVYLDKGPDATSNHVIVSKTFNHVYRDAENQDLVDVVNAIVALQKYTLYNIVKIDSTTLAE